MKKTLTKTITRRGWFSPLSLASSSGGGGSGPLGPRVTCAASGARTARFIRQLESAAASAPGSANWAP
eukprot:3024154-Pyramimonas_sp.AAC.1